MPSRKAPEESLGADAPDLLYLRHGVAWAEEALDYFHYFDDFPPTD